MSETRTPIVVFDTETEAFAPAPAPPPAFVVGGWQVIDAEGKPGEIQTTQDKEWLCNMVMGALGKGWIVAGHNLSFDLAVLGVVPDRTEQVWDTMIGHLLIELKQNDCYGAVPRFKSLAACAGVKLLGKDSTRLSFRVNQSVSAEQLAYLHKDVETTTRLVQRQLGKVPGGVKELTLQVRAHLALNQLERTGVPVNLERITQQRVIQQQRRREAVAVLKEDQYYRPARTGPKGGTYKASLDTKRFRILIEQLCTEQDIKPRHTKTGLIETDKAFLLQFQNHEIVKNWLKYRDSEKIERTFLSAWQQGNGTVHPRYNLLLRSGRTSSYGPNMQQVPSRGRRGRVKEVFVPPPGRVFYELDYRQLELCTLAYLTQGRMLMLINKGDDLHRWLGAQYFDKAAEDVAKQERQLMKCANFGLPGGMGPDKFRAFIRSNGLDDPGKEVARDLINTWLAAYPEMQDWLKDDCTIPRELRWVWAGKADEYEIDTATQDYAWTEAMQYAFSLSRKKKMPGKLWRALNTNEGSPELEKWLTHRRVVITGGKVRCPVTYTEQRNSKFQGLAANLTKDALAAVVFADLDVTVHAFVHDSVLVSVPAADQSTPTQVAQIMLEAAHRWIPGVRAGVEICGPGNSWYEAKNGNSEEVYIKI